MERINEVKPDAMVCDICLPGMNGIELLKNIKARHPRIAVVMISLHSEAVYAERALRAGALGYVMKQESMAQVIMAIRKALAGEYYVSTRLNGVIFNKALGSDGPGKHVCDSPVARLSDRELEVFEMIGRGVDTGGIAAALHLSSKTVDSHRLHIKEKLQIRSATELMKHAIQWVENECAGRLLPSHQTG